MVKLNEDLKQFLNERYRELIFPMSVGIFKVMTPEIAMEFHEWQREKEIVTNGEQEKGD